jgi:hypothetical protein
MIVFNTRAKAEHYIKHLVHINKKHEDSRGDSHFNYYYINNKRVLSEQGWRCTCGCGRGSKSITVIGRIKDPLIR